MNVPSGSTAFNKIHKVNMAHLTAFIQSELLSVHSIPCLCSSKPVLAYISWSQVMIFAYLYLSVFNVNEPLRTIILRKFDFYSLSFVRFTLWRGINHKLCWKYNSLQPLLVLQTIYSMKIWVWTILIPLNIFEPLVTFVEVFFLVRNIFFFFCFFLQLNFFSVVIFSGLVLFPKLYTINYPDSFLLSFYYLFSQNFLLLCFLVLKTSIFFFVLFFLFFL